jgi:nucleotide-binding universal stress UspA family protein
MPFCFRTIVVPVDFSINSDVAINKALEMAEEHAIVHLLHVLDLTSFNLPAVKIKKLSRYNDRADNRGAGKMLKQWKESIEDDFPSIEVRTWLVRAASIQQAIADKAKEVQADLIVIGKSSTHTWFPFLKTVISSELSALTGIAVLTVKPGSLHNKIKTVVVPVTDGLTQNKIEVISALCKKYKMKVHLLTFINNDHGPEEFSASTLLQLYQWLKNSLHCSVEYAVLHGTNKVKSILAYAENIDADILLVHPKSETRIGWWNRHISDVLPSQSKVQVLTVQPIQ